MYDAIMQNPVYLTIFLAWCLAWKGVALWKAAKADSKKWFVALLIINTVGLLEILYIYLFSKKSGAANQVKEG